MGIFSDIIKAIEHYYNVVIHDKKLKREKEAPLFIDTRAYKGFERRKSVRIKAKVDIHFPIQEFYKKSKTKDISLHGFLFEAENILPLNSYITIQIDLPEEFSAVPIAAVVQVARVIPLKNKKFDIGVKLINIPKENIGTLIKYARMHEK